MCLKIKVVSNCVIDTIEIDKKRFEQIGGPACYCGLVSRKFNFDVFLFTKFGPDFPYKDVLTKNKIKFEDALSTKPTTRFKICIKGVKRDLFLQNKCEPVSFHEFSTDGTIISPVFDEITTDVFSKLKNNSNFILLDPQGFLREIDDYKKIHLKPSKIDLTGISAIKASMDELECIAGGNDVSAMKKLQNQGIQFVLRTNNEEISLLANDRLYSLRLPNKEIYDTTGIGDIFCAVFCCTMLKEKDFLWAFCFAAGAAQAALDTKGLGLSKVPEKGTTEINASYFYNTIKFKQV